MFFKNKPADIEAQSVENKVDELVKVMRDTVYEYDTGMAFSKRACAEIPLFHSHDGVNRAGETHSLGFAYFSVARAPKCDYIVQSSGGINTYFKKQADVQVNRDGSIVKSKTKRKK